MANDNETVEQACEEFKTPKYTCKNCDFKICPSINMFSDRVLTAHKREIADEKRISDAVIQSLRDKKLEMAGEIAEKEAEIAKLRECLNEAIREKCPFTRMSCKHGETCDYECGTFKWRKALGEEGGAK